MVAAFTAMGVFVPFSARAVRFPNPSYWNVCVHGVVEYPGAGAEDAEVNRFSESYWYVTTSSESASVT